MTHWSLQQAGGLCRAARAARADHSRPASPTWVAMLGEEVNYRDGQRKFETRSWTLEQRTKKMCEEFLQSVKGDAQMTACIPMEVYEKGHRPWWVH